MSVSTTTSCPHGQHSFVWLGGGPWLGDKADPDYGSYPWVHAAPVGPGSLEVCDLMPFASPAEAGEACADCGHGSGRHEWPPDPVTLGEDRSPGRCLDCPCARMRYGTAEGYRAGGPAAAVPHSAAAAPKRPKPERHAQLSLFIRTS